MTQAADDPHEARLIAEAQAGDRAALETLLERHLPGLEAFVRLRVGRGLARREGASDVVQSACRDALVGAEGFRYGGSDGFRRWLFAIAARKVADKLAFHAAGRRDAAREVNGDFGASRAASSIIAQLSGTTPSPSQAAIGSELLDRIELALEELSEDERDVVLYSRVACLSRTEVAEAMNRSEGSVRNLLHRALVKLSEQLTKS